jgi:hypothetical protein
VEKKRTRWIDKTRTCKWIFESVLRMSILRRVFSKNLANHLSDHLPKCWTDYLKRKDVDDFQPLLKLENHPEQRK